MKYTQTNFTAKLISQLLLKILRDFDGISIYKGSINSEIEEELSLCLVKD